jgi:pseudouridine-5'-phosphate glycosidase
MVTIKGTLSGGPVDAAGMLYILDLWMNQKINESEAAQLLGATLDEMDYFYSAYWVFQSPLVLVSNEELAQAIWNAWKAGW